MAKKKQKLLKTKNLKQLKKDKRLRKFFPLIMLGLGILTGLWLAWLQPPDLTPKNLIWGADRSVRVPGDLAEFLRLQDDCQSYRGTASPNGVGLWGVYQVSKGEFAKIAYGCGFGLTRYIMAVKDGSNWKLLPIEEYFAKSGSNFLPNCEQVDRYKIDKSIEPFCIESTGAPRENPIK